MCKQEIFQKVMRLHFKMGGNLKIMHLTSTWVFIIQIKSVYISVLTSTNKKNKIVWREKLYRVLTLPTIIAVWY